MSSKTEKTTKPAKVEEASTAIKIPKGGTNLVNLSVEKVSIKKNFNPRTDLGDLSELKANLRQHGVLNPITVCATKPGADTYYVIAGARRFTAWKELGKANIPATVLDLAIDAPEAFQVAMAENSDEGRCNLTPEDQANAFAKVLEAVGGEGKEAEVAKVCGCKKITVVRALKFNLVPESVRACVRDETLSRNAALAVLEVPEEVRAKVAKQVAAASNAAKDKKAPALTEKDVRRMANESKASLREGGEESSSKKKTSKGETSRHNVPFGADPDKISVQRGARELMDMRRKLTALALNQEADIEDKIDGAKEKLAETLAALAALYWAAGIGEDLLVTSGTCGGFVDYSGESIAAAIARGKDTVIAASKEAAEKEEPAKDKKAKTAKKEVEEAPAPKTEKKAKKSKPAPAEEAEGEEAEEAPEAAAPKTDKKSKKKAAKAAESNDEDHDEDEEG